MAITHEQIKTIRQELNSLKPDTATAGNSELTVKQTIIALAPTLERMKKRGFELTEIVAKLHDKGIEVKPQTLAKYLAEARRQKDARKNKRQAANPHCSAPKTACRNAGPQAADTAQPPVAKAAEIANRLNNGKERRVYMGGFEIIPDTPLGEL
ncbi:MAG: hypothetical protein OSJ28_10850 [Desulfovibrio sp.]|nr:hypothetical protein [Desulfovibrio sp.]